MAKDKLREDTLFQVKDLHTYFYSDDGVVKAVNGVGFSIDRGKTLGLVGESGCGKTVTGLSILRLIPDPPGRIVRGQILFEGQDLLKLNEREMCNIRGNHISMIFQEPMTSLNPIFTVGYQVSEAIRLHHKISRHETMDLTVQMLQKVGIPDPERRAREYPHQLSGGMRQRVMIAMSLACNPSMIIADEPTTALDVTIQAQVLDLINRLKQDTGASILLITHDLGVIAEMADSVAVMYTGKIVEYAGSDEFFERPKHPYTLGLMNSIPRIDMAVPENKMLKAIPGVVPNMLELPKGCAFQERCSEQFNLCRKKDPPLFEAMPGHLVKCWLYER